MVRADARLADMDRGLWAGLVSAALAGVEPAAVACDTEDCHGDNTPCRVRIHIDVVAV